jgi:hypothetical protein
MLVIDMFRAELSAQTHHKYVPFRPATAHQYKLARRDSCISLPLTPCRHTTRFILVYIVFLPFALWRQLGFVSLAVGPLVALLLCGIENIGA